MLTLSEAAAAVVDRAAAAPGRFVLAVAGAPGAGKSTASEAVRAQAEAADLSTAIVGMDGWHLAHNVLMERGDVEIKGAPETFDAPGFVEAMGRVRRQGPGEASIWLPQFRREIEDAVAGAIEVRADHRFIIVEGNYLYLPEDPWNTLADLFDESWFLTPSEELRQARLIARHEFHGRTPEAARERTLGSDERNAQRVWRSAQRPDVLAVDPG